jgi:hypothetical protein
MPDSETACWMPDVTLLRPELIYPLADLSSYISSTFLSEQTRQQYFSLKTKSAPAISHQPNEQAGKQSLFYRCKSVIHAQAPYIFPPKAQTTITTNGWNETFGWPWSINSLTRCDRWHLCFMAWYMCESSCSLTLSTVQLLSKTWYNAAASTPVFFVYL